MRYYKIVIYPVNGSTPIIFTSLTNNGAFNGSALEISLDIYQYEFATPAGLPWVQIKGISYETISQLSNFNGANIQIYLGMSEGLPLANPQQASLVVNGTITQAFANWQGNQISLDIVCVYATGSPLTPVNLSGTWYKNQSMQDWITLLLKQVYPAIPISGTLNQNLIYTEDQPAYFQDLYQFASRVKDLSKQIIKKRSYPGVDIILNANGFYLFDGTIQEKPFLIDYYGIIGNLTWLDISTIQAKLVMRGDLFVGQLINFPPNIPVLNLVNSFSQYRNNLNFSGNFTITQIRHVGNSRQPDANSWCTIINCSVVINE